jgi:hypothetical protein
VGEVDFLRLLREQEDLTAGVIVALLEAGEGLGSRASQPELRTQFRPVKLEGSAAL